MTDIVILTALPVEYKAVRSYLTDLKEEVHPQGTIYERGKFIDNKKLWDVGIVEIGPGNNGAAGEAERAVSYFKPDIMLFVGVAGGIKDVKIGDVVASTKVYGYESGKIEEIFKSRPNIGLSSYNLEQRARVESRKEDWFQRLPSIPNPIPKVFVAPIAAGEKVVASTKSEVFRLLRSHYGDAIAVEMEGIGFLKVAHTNQKVSALIIRGISDLIDGKSNADAEGSQEIAAYHASAFAFQILAKFKSSDQSSNFDSKVSSSSLLTDTLTVRSEQLNELDLETLADLIKRSGRISRTEARRALCISIKVDPDELAFIENTAPIDFATQLVFLLHQTNNVSALWRLCQKIEPHVPGFASDLTSIKAKLDCVT